MVTKHVDSLCVCVCVCTDGRLPAEHESQNAQDDVRNPRFKRSVSFDVVRPEFSIQQVTDTNPTTEHNFGEDGDCVK